MPEETGFYDDPSVYDVLHTPGTAAEVDGLERVARRFASCKPALANTWLEPACGSGRYLRVAARRGRRVIGFDLSPAMIEYAARHVRPAGKGPAPSLFVGDMTAFVGDRCPPGCAGFAFNLINSFRHLMTDHDALRHLEQIALALAPGGVYAIGMSPALYGLEPPTEDVWTGARGQRRVTQVVQFEPPQGRSGGARVERVVSHITVTTPRGTTHLDSRYGLRTYSMEQWLALLERSPMALVGQADAEGADHPGTPLGYRLFILSPR